MSAEKRNTEKAERLAYAFLAMVKNDTSVAVESAKNVKSLAKIFETIYDEAYDAGYSYGQSDAVEGIDRQGEEI